MTNEDNMLDVTGIIQGPGTPYKLLDGSQIGGLI